MSKRYITNKVIRAEINECLNRSSLKQELNNLYNDLDVLRANAGILEKVLEHLSSNDPIAQSILDNYNALNLFTPKSVPQGDDCFVEPLKRILIEIRNYCLLTTEDISNQIQALHFTDFDCCISRIVAAWEELIQLGAFSLGTIPQFTFLYELRRLNLNCRGLLVKIIHRISEQLGVCVEDFPSLDGFDASPYFCEAVRAFAKERRDIQKAIKARSDLQLSSICERICLSRSSLENSDDIDDIQRFRDEAQLAQLVLDHAIKDVYSLDSMLLADLPAKPSPKSRKRGAQGVSTRRRRT